MIGIVGHSGAGKTTLVNLICRFYDVTQGAIRIDGVDIRDLSMDELRRQIGVVLQTPFLFHGTLAENIAYGKPGRHPRGDHPRPPRPPTPTTSSSACRKATTPSSARAARGSRAASASASPSPAPSCTTRAS